MNLIARSSDRAPAVLSSTASESPGKTRQESQTPLSPQVEMDDRMGRPVVCSQRAHQFVIEDDETNSYTEAESELSLGSSSFLRRVKDQVRKRQTQSSEDATKDSDKHSEVWGMFVSSKLQASVFMVKNYSDNWHSIINTEDLTMKQMFDISTRLVSEQDEISGLETICWENHSWKYLSLIGDERSHQSPAHKGLRLFRFCIVSWKDTREPPIELLHGKTD